MVQEQSEIAQDSLPETLDSSSSSADQSHPSLSRNVSFSRLNAQAPEFVPTRPPPRPDLHPPARIIAPPPPGMVHHVFPPPPNSPFHVPIQGPVPMVPPVHHNHHSHHHVHYRPKQQYYGGGGGFREQDVAVQNQKSQLADADSINGVSDEGAQKVLNQVEYYFSDLNLATTDHLMKYISKDPDGYVPISVVASFKKIKTFISSQAQLASVLQKSSKLAVSEDGKKVKRQHPLTESDLEELQSRIVIAENLPDDHCHQNLMRIFSAVGSVKTIRTCQPQFSNGGGSSASRQAKADGMLFSNKLHAFVEYESVEVAEKAVAELTDERNWRSGLRVRLMLTRRGPQSKTALVRGKRGNDGEGQFEEDDASTSEQHPNDKLGDDTLQQYDSHSHENAGEENVHDDVQQRKGRNRGSRGRGRGRGQYHHNNRGNHHMGTSPNNSIMYEQPTVAKPPPGPRMPDGTRGFSLGRGKPIAINIA